MLLEGKKALVTGARRGIGVPDDIAGAVVYLCSPLAGDVNGTCLTVDGGFLVQGTPD
jgi:NAD(P)-dependent dehydrogenase (short-subunit alcohol dehydrogenase family)